MFKQRGLVLESYVGRLNVRTTFHEEKETFGNCSDRGFGFEGLQREERSESVVKRNIPSDVEELSLQGVDSFFRRRHRAAHRGGWNQKIEKRSREWIPTVGYIFLFRTRSSKGMRAT